jgi:Zn-dependent protease
MWTKSWQIARFFNIPIKVHWSFGLMILYVFLIGWKESMNARGIMGFAGFVALLFICVLLHEFGHALTARRYGVDTKDIIISPVGGIARLVSMPQESLAEFWVAIMGPAVNVAIALLLAIIISLTPLSFMPTGTAATVFNEIQNMFPLLMWMNIGLVIFNLIPAFPMDGGRVLRSLLTLRWSLLQSTRIASFSGQTIAVAFIFWGLYQGEYILPFIGLFVFITAALEYRNMKRYNASLQQTAAQMARPFTPLFAEDPMERAREVYDLGREKYFLVLDHAYHPRGVLHPEDIASCDDLCRIENRVSDFMHPVTQKVTHDQSLEEVMHIFQTSDAQVLPVYSGYHLIGVIHRSILE